MNERDILKLGYVLQADGSYAHASVAARLPAAEPEPCPVPALAGDPPHEVRSPGRRRVSITVRTTRLRDPDNNLVKFIVDALRYHRVIADDTEAHIALEVHQEKVRTKPEQGTLIEIL